MKQFCFLLAIPMIFLLFGCTSRYQVFELMEMGNQLNSSKHVEGQVAEESVNETYIQRVLVDTKTGKIYYFKNSKYLETVDP